MLHSKASDSILTSALDSQDRKSEGRWSQSISPQPVRGGVAALERDEVVNSQNRTSAGESWEGGGGRGSAACVLFCSPSAY